MERETSAKRTLSVGLKANLYEKLVPPGKWLTVKKGLGRDPPHRSDSFELNSIL